MKIWSKTLTRLDLHVAVDEVNMDFPGCEVLLADFDLYEGPRTRRFDHVSLCSRRGTRPRNSGTKGAVPTTNHAAGEAPITMQVESVHTWNNAASWTEWGWFLARVFDKDPNARANDYRGREDFHFQTLGRFIDPRSPRKRQAQRALAGLT